ncbi:MAG: hypothetical protein ABSE56_01985 [Bryobacteraceae bacterium]|jgi:hypothetical protein
MPVQPKSNPLLEEGAKSYPQALLALSDFGQQVQDMCCAAMKRHLTELGDALGLPLQAKQVKPFAGPSSLSSGNIDGTWASLGAKIGRPSGAKCDLWNYIWWGDDTPPLNAVVSLSFADPEVAERAWASMRHPGSCDFDEDEREIHHSRPLEPADLTQLEAILDEMNREWIALWQKVGGVKQFLGKR